MTDLQRVNELTAPPIVGQTYLVPCVKIRNGHGIDDMPPGWWPTIGPEHEDAEIIKFTSRHIHLDGRFLLTEQLDGRLGGCYTLREILGAPLCTTDPTGRDLPITCRPLKFEFRPLECLRPMPDWDQLFAHLGVSAPPWMADLEKAFAKQWIKRDCRTCPHRGMPLASVPVAADGGVTCPGHGLRWHAETGHLMPRKRKWP